jgi:hypothetical protein
VTSIAEPLLATLQTKNRKKTEKQLRNRQRRHFGNLDIQSQSLRKPFPVKKTRQHVNNISVCLNKGAATHPPGDDCSQNPQRRAKSYQINYCPLLPGIDLNILITHLAERPKFHKFNTGNGRHHSQGPHKEKNKTKAQTSHHNASMMLQQNTRESTKYTQR